EWHKNLQLSLSCCLALPLPHNDLQGEGQSMIDDNERDDNAEMEFRERRAEVVKNRNKKCHRWRQTVVVRLQISTVVVYGSLEGNQPMY
ncbi:hypothetical protein pdam_00023792, partial [Pocillopora damicornis]